MKSITTLKLSDARTLALAAMAYPIVWLGLNSKGYESLSRRFVVRQDQRPATLEDLRRAAWLVNGLGAAMLGDGVCLLRSLVLQRVLARRGVRTELRIGVRLDGSAAHAELKAHAWLEFAGKPINDKEDIGQCFAALGPAQLAARGAKP